MQNTTFESVHVPYMLNQAGMTFFRLGAYYAGDSKETLAFQKEMLELRELMNQVASRVKRGMKVPMTWLNKLRLEGLSAVVVAEEHKLSYSEWTEQFHRTLRFLETYKAAK